MDAPRKSARPAWLVVGPLLAGICLLLAWSVYRNAWPNLQAYFEPANVAGRAAQRELAAQRARHERQIRSIIELAADHIRQLGGTCSQSAVKGENILDEIDQSKWRGKDPDLALLRVFLLLEEDNRINDHSNWFTVTLPPATTDDSLLYVENLTNLCELSMPGSSVTDAGLTHLERLTNPYALNLSKTKVTGSGLDRLESLSKLRTLDLSGTRVTDDGLDGLAKLPSLISLNLSNTQVTDNVLPLLRCLPSLDRVDVSGTKMTIRGMAEVAQQRPEVEVVFAGGSLRRETLDLDRGARDGLLSDFARVRRFRTIRLSDSQVTDAGLAGLTGQDNLEHLWIVNVPITDAGLAHLSGLPALRELYLLKLQVSGVGLHEVQGLDNLSTLCLTDSRIADAGLSALPRFECLSELHLHRTCVTDAGLAHLKTLDNLKKLGLSQTGITDVGLAHVASLRNLEDLNLTKTQITDAGLVSVKALPRLRTLCLSDTVVTAQGLNHLVGMRHLRELTIVHTRISEAEAKDWHRRMPFVFVRGDTVWLQGKKDGVADGRDGGQP